VPDKPNFPTTDEFVANPVHVHAYMIQSVSGDEKQPKKGAVIILHNPIPTRAPVVIHLTPAMISRHFPRVGDYYVIQADDYRYINPVDVFERKYRPRSKGELNVPAAVPADGDAQGT
jgi:hypothetical protein